MPTRPTVIVADHSEAFLMYMSILLQRLDFEVLPMGTGISALKMAKAVQPNLMILGTALPELNGPDVLKAMRAEQDLATIPILMAGENDGDEASCRELDCQDFLKKPIELEALHAALERCRIYPNSQRRFMRAPYDQKVRLTFNRKDYECQAVTLSEGGIYIRRKLPLPQGCLLDIEIPLSGQNTIQLEGEVIYTRQLSEDRFIMPPGMAVRFLAVNEKDAAVLNETIRQLLIGDILEEQDEPVLKG